MSNSSLRSPEYDRGFVDAMQATVDILKHKESSCRCGNCVCETPALSPQIEEYEEGRNHHRDN